jgi:hypothetical protein
VLLVAIGTYVSYRVLGSRGQDAREVRRLG